MILAHRGSVEGGIRENTLEAFARAAQLGADGVELDVRITGDGCLVLHHDAVVAAARPVRIENCPRNAPEVAGMAGLEEALEVCYGRGLFVNVEVKSTGNDPSEECARQVAGLCAGRHGRRGGLVVSSFSIVALQAAREVAPDLPLAWLISRDAAAAESHQLVRRPLVREQSEA